MESTPTPPYEAGLAGASGSGTGAPPEGTAAYGQAPAARPPRKSRRGLIIGAISGAVVLALIGGVTSWFLLARVGPEETARAYADAWNSGGFGDHAAMAEIATGGGELKDAYTRVAKNLGVESSTVTLGQVNAKDDRATAAFEATLALRDSGEWSFSGELPLRQADGEWKVAFSPAAIHPELSEGETLVRTNEWGERGRILGAEGSRLDTDDASGSVRMLTGKVAAATKEDLKDLGPAYEVGDPFGASGIQRAYAERLAGTPATSIQVAPIDAEQSEDSAEDTEASVLGTIGGTPGKDVTTSLDPDVQSAAAQAIVGQDKPTAFVAVRPSTGEVLAAANVPGGFNRAIQGRYPPGSAFKIASYEALLDSGLSTGSTMSCPKTATIGGREFKNAGDAAYGSQSVTEAFATSCNTALVKAVDQRLDPAGLTAAAEEFGMNSKLKIGIPTTQPSFPKPDSAGLMAAASIGQGKVLTSPLHMATLPAAVAEGTWHSPVLITEPQVEGRPEPSKIENAEALRSMMRSVITDGTAKGAGFTGEVYGKTGSAEFGTLDGEGDELETHAWFIGYKNDIAFSVVVEGGGGGGSVAAPLAKDFLADL